MRTASWSTARLAGELAAFETLVERHRDVVFRVAARIVGRAEAEDVSQDAFLRAFHRLSAFRGDASFRVWLLRITRNAALDERARRRAEPVDSLEPLLESSSAEETRMPADNSRRGSVASGSRTRCVC